MVLVFLVKVVLEGLSFKKRMGLEREKVLIWNIINKNMKINIFVIIIEKNWFG